MGASCIRPLKKEETWGSNRVLCMFLPLMNLPVYHCTVYVVLYLLSLRAVPSAYHTYFPLFLPSLIKGLIILPDISPASGAAKWQSPSLPPSHASHYMHEIINQESLLLPPPPSGRTEDRGKKKVGGGGTVVVQVGGSSSRKSGGGVVLIIEVFLLFIFVLCG